MNTELELCDGVCPKAGTPEAAVVVDEVPNPLDNELRELNADPELDVVRAAKVDG